MNPDRLKTRLAGALRLAAAAALMLAAPALQAQAWPSKPIKIVVPFPAGGTSDVLARLFGQKMSETWGQPVVVDNKPGSSGNLGADLVATPDLLLEPRWAAMSAAWFWNMGLIQPRSKARGKMAV